MAVCCTKHIRPCLVNGAVNYEGGLVEHSYWSTIYDPALVIDANQIALPNQRERYTERVHPKSCTVDRVTQGYMASDAFVEAVFSKYTECRSETTFEIFPFFVLVDEFRRAREFGRLHLGLLLTQARLKGGFC